MTRWDVFPLQIGPAGTGAGLVGGWVITSYFGSRTDPLTGAPGSGHGGQDEAFSGCSGYEVYSPGPGTYAGGYDYSGGGNWAGVTMDGSLGYFGCGHLASFAPGASYRRVSAGDLLGYVGTTGGSTGPHAYIAYRPHGSNYYADPYDVLLDASSRPVGGGTPPSPISEEGMPHQFSFPDGTTYVLIANADQRGGWEWHHVQSALALTDSIYAGCVTTTGVRLAAGDDNADAMWERFSVRNGPHQRP